MLADGDLLAHAGAGDFHLITIGTLFDVDVVVVLLLLYVVVVVCCCCFVILIAVVVRCHCCHCCVIARRPAPARACGRGGFLSHYYDYYI